MERELAWATVKRIAALRGNETIPTEDVIDLAQAVLYLLEKFDGPEPDHESKDCWLAGNDGHLRCTPPPFPKERK